MTTLRRQHMLMFQKMKQESERINLNFKNSGCKIFKTSKKNDNPVFKIQNPDKTFQETEYTSYENALKSFK